LYYGEYFKYERNYRLNNPSPLWQEDHEILIEMRNRLKGCRDEPLVEGEYWSRKWYRLNGKNIQIPSNHERFKLKDLREQLLNKYKCLWLMSHLVYLKHFLPKDLIAVVADYLEIVTRKSFDHLGIPIDVSQEIYTKNK
jgi:hypothetical protein